MKEFKSKVGHEILIPVLILMIGIMLLPTLTGGSMKDIATMAVIMVPAIAFTLHMFYNISYQIINRKLLIKCGFFHRTILDISKITSISPTRNMIASPAASLDRIELKYGKWNAVLISPNNKKGFIAELLKINPDINVKYKADS